MFGIDLASLISGGMIQDLVRAHTGEALSLAAQLARQQCKLQDGEVMGVLLAEHKDEQGRPTWVVFPQVLMKDTLVLVRRLPYIDLRQFLEKAPIEQWVNEGKKWRKVIEDIEGLQAKERKASNPEKRAALREKQRLLGEQLPQWLQQFIIDQAAAPAPKALPAHG